MGDKRLIDDASYLEYFPYSTAVGLTQQVYGFCGSDTINWLNLSQFLPGGQGRYLLSFVQYGIQALSC